MYISAGTDQGCDPYCLCDCWSHEAVVTWKSSQVEEWSHEGVVTCRIELRGQEMDCVLWESHVNRLDSFLILCVFRLYLGWLLVPRYCDDIMITFEF